MAPKSPQPTAFDIAVQSAQAAGQTVEHRNIADVALLLRSAGVAETKIAEIQANPSTVALIKGNPDLAQRLAEMFPASHAITYYETRQAAGFDLAPEEVFTSGGPDAMARNIATGPRTSDTGAIEYPGGVIVDPATQTVVFPPTDASIAGSPAWLAQVPKWSEDKMKTWTKTLKKNGYITSNKVDLVTFTDALVTFHNNRYLYGGGKPVDISAGQEDVTKAAFGGILDKSVLKTEVRPWFQEIFGDDPSEEEAEFWADKLAKTALRLANQKGMTPADAASVASARVQERAMKDPAVQKWQELEETDTGLHDSFVNLFQVLSS